jgi:hypothetical protein
MFDKISTIALMGATFLVGVVLAVLSCMGLGTILTYGPVVLLGLIPMLIGVYLMLVAASIIHSELKR